MSNELTIEGVEYISSKRASEITGYSQDYVGQLARAGKILGKRVGGLWYIVADSLAGHKELADTYKPIPPSTGVKKSTEDSSIITFEGRTYVSAARAAKLTSYHQDYIGQLARGGKIMSRQVGKRWYIDIEALRVHKKEKDALLGAVQSSSVGLLKRENDTKSTDIGTNTPILPDAGLHYTYKSEETPLLPVIEDKLDVSTKSDDEAAPAEQNPIPIRIIRPAIKVSQPIENRGNFSEKKGSRIPVLSIFLKIFPVLAISALALIAYNFSPKVISISTLKTPTGYSIVSVPSSESMRALIDKLSNLFAKEIRYSRE